MTEDDYHIAIKLLKDFHKKEFLGVRQMIRCNHGVRKFWYDFNPCCSRTHTYYAEVKEGKGILFIEEDGRVIFDEKINEINELIEKSDLEPSLKKLIKELTTQVNGELFRLLDDLKRILRK